MSRTPRIRVPPAVRQYVLERDRIAVYSDCLIAMSQAETKLSTLTFEKYLTYDDGTDSRYELVDGELVLMPPPVPKHSDIVIFCISASI